MGYLIYILLVAPQAAAFPPRESVLFALLCGLLIGTLFPLTSWVADRVRQKLGISEETEEKYLVTYAGVTTALILLFAIGLQLFAPSYEQRRDFFDHQISELGYEQFFSLSILGIAVSLPISVLRAYLRKRALGRNQSPE